MEKKKKIEFTIIKNDPTDGHKGFGIGSINLENVTPVMIDIQEKEIWIEPQAMHARSKTERGVRYLKTLDELLTQYPKEDTKKYWIIWVVMDRNENGPYYYGLGACELYINRPARRGYKSMPEHVNHMDRALKGRIIIDNMDPESRKLLGDFLRDYNEEYWNNSSEELRQAFAE